MTELPKDILLRTLCIRFDSIAADCHNPARAEGKTNLGEPGAPGGNPRCARWGGLRSRCCWASLEYWPLQVSARPTDTRVRVTAIMAMPIPGTAMAAAAASVLATSRGFTLKAFRGTSAVLVPTGRSAMAC